MPLTRIRNTSIANGGITTAKLADDAVTTAKLDDTSGGLTLPGIEYVKVPVGTTAQRPSSPVNGYLRYNTTFEKLEQYANGQWQVIDSPPVITSVAYPGSVTAADPAGGETITLAGSNFQAGATVTIGGTSATSVSVVSSTSITFTTPVKTAGDYDVVVINSNGLQASLTNGISYNGTPSFTTAAGNLGSILEDIAMSTITIVAAEPDGGTLAFSVTSGALPTGVSLGSANGQLTGTPNVNVTSNTTYNFTVTATDDENQTNSRAFNLIVLRPIYATPLNDSLRFNDDDSAYLSRTPSSNGNRKTWTLSAWIKRANIVDSTFVALGSSLGICLRFSGNALQSNILTIGSTTSSAVFRDPTAWQHIVLTLDTTQASNNDRLKIYVNGSEVSYSANATITQNSDLGANTNTAHYFGCEGRGSPPSSFFDGYMSDVHFIDGQALTPTSFAEEHNGVWAPKAYSGSYGTNGFKLDFADSSAVGNDVSGNNNDFTASGFSASDVVPDSPTTNFATFNPIFKSSTSIIPYANNSITLSEGNLRANLNTGNETQSAAFSTFLVPTSGKWYWEIFCIAESSGSISGVGVIEQATGTFIRSASNTSGRTYAANDIINIAFDADNNRIYFGINGTFPADQTPTDVSDGTSATGSDYIPYVWGNHSVSPNQFCANFGQDSTFAGATTAGGNTDANSIGDFKYTVPSGYLALCAKNLSESTINTTLDDRPEDYFNVVTYSGTSAVQSITTVGFQPDFTWLKRRDGTGDHVLYDSVRGTPKRLFTNTSDFESATGDGFAAFNSTGFNLDGTGGGGNVNTSGRTYVGWSWKAGGAPTATNSAGVGNVPTSGSVMIDGVASTSTLAGTIAATKISANTKSGFSIVSYTGFSGSSGTATVGHSLSQAPEIIIHKSRTRTSAWWTQAPNVLASPSHFLALNETSTPYNLSSYGTMSAPTSSVFSINGVDGVGGESADYVAYCFHSVEGYSKIGGVYTGNGSADGTFVYTGFRPAWVMVRASSSASNWFLWDTARNTYNATTTALFPNSSLAEEVTLYPIDVLSNGFKLRGASGLGFNENALTYIYMAFAEDPFKYSEAR